jgi:hypothetical protein
MPVLLLIILAGCGDGAAGTGGGGGEGGSIGSGPPGAGDPVAIAGLSAEVTRKYPCVFGTGEARPACASYKLALGLESQGAQAIASIKSLAIAVNGVEVAAPADCAGAPWLVDAGATSAPIALELTYTEGAADGLAARLVWPCGGERKVVTVSGLPPAPLSGPVSVSVSGLLADGQAWTASANGALIDAAGDRITFVVEPGAAPPDFDRLSTAYEAIGEASDYDILVHAGTYAGESIAWSSAKTFGDHTIRIAAAPGERPVFDGKGKAGTFVSVKTHAQQNTNLVFEGLTIQSYYTAFSLDGGTDASEWSGGNVIRDCIFDNIGDRDGDGVGKSWGSIVFEYQRGDVIENNVFNDIYNDPSEGPLMTHVLYLSHGSSNNVIRNNFIHNASGDPFRIRDGANNNLISGNYTDRAGAWAPITRYRTNTNGEDWVHHNKLEKNLFLYGNPTSMATTKVAACYDNNGSGSSEVPCKADEWDIDADTLEVFRSTYANTLGVPAAAIGDFDGDGAAEVMLAMSSSGVSRVVKSKLAVQYLGDVLWRSTKTSVVGLASGDFDGSGHDQVVAALRAGNGPTELHRGSGSGEAGLTDLGLLGTTEGTARTVTAMTAGDYDGDGIDELVIAYWDGVKAEVYRTVVGASAELVYEAPSSKITELATGDFDGDGKVEVAAAVVSGGETRVYVGHGAGDLTATLLYTTLTESVTALAAGEYNDNPADGDELLTALFTSTSSATEVWKGDGSTPAGGVKTFAKLYASQGFRVPVLVGGDYRSEAGDETVGVFTTASSNTVQVWAGNGNTDLLSYFKFFQWPKL